MHSAYHVEIAEDSYATHLDISFYRRDGLIADPTIPDRTTDDDELDRDNRVDERTLQKETRIAGGGGSKNKNRKKAMRPLTSAERAANFDRITKEMAPDAYLGETETQRAERHMLEAKAAMERAEASKGGRPRKGSAVRKMYGARLEPETMEVIQAAGHQTLVDFIEAQVETLKAA